MDLTRPQLTRALRKLHLPVFVAQHTAQGAVAANEGWSFDRYLLTLAELELQQRETRRIQKLLVKYGFDAISLPVDQTPTDRKERVS